MIVTRSMTSYAKTASRWSRRTDPIAASAPRKMDVGLGEIPGAGWSNASSPGYNGSIAFLSAGSFIRRTSSVSCNSPASSSSSNDFEIGSNKINKGMKQTLNADNPEHFFFYHNGITALCEQLSFENTTRKLTLRGIGVVNGCQSL